MTSLSRLLPTAVLAMALPGAAAAQVPDDIVAADFLRGWATEGGGYMAGIRLRLAPGWKTYWRAPGDAGIPPMVEWTGAAPEGGMQIHWPVPEVFDQNGMRSIGYAGEVVLPMEFSRAPGTVEGQLHIGVCEAVCVPVVLQFSGALEAPGSESAQQAIRAAVADRPMTRVEAGAGAVECAVAPIRDGMRVEYTVEMPPLAGPEAAVVELAAPMVWVSEPVVARDGATLRVSAELVPDEARPFSLSRDALRLTVIGAGQAVDIAGCAAPS